MNPAAPVTSDAHQALRSIGRGGLRPETGRPACGRSSGTRSRAGASAPARRCCGRRTRAAAASRPRSRSRFEELELVPLRHDDDRVRAGGRLVGRLAVRRRSPAASGVRWPWPPGRRRARVAPASQEPLDELDAPASRMSSVFGLKASPSTAMTRPSSGSSALRDQRPRSAVARSRFTSTTARSSAKS